MRGALYRLSYFMEGRDFSKAEATELNVTVTVPTVEVMLMPSDPGLCLGDKISI